MDGRTGFKKKRITHYRLLIKGVVQGVGFRPFVYNLALTMGIKGSVLNSGEGLVIEAEGEEQNVRNFLKELKENTPRLAKISNYQEIELPPCGYKSFEILKSAPGNDKEALIPPDVAACPECIKEIFDPQDRHYQYPFTNCTNCGPRFTVINEVPYDRPKTSMAVFKMCDECAREYSDPVDRRFHAQPIACPKCGPRVEVVDRQGVKIDGPKGWLELCWDILKEGKILALKGLGGFHLICNAKNTEAVKVLRRRKGRDAKPFAVMGRDLETVQRYCLTTQREAELLSSPQAPIVILRKKISCMLPGELAPGLKTLGFMLPYTPLHHLLLNGPFDVLVMTSGNYSSLPLVKENSRAFSELHEIADFFLAHDREIVNRCDDSLVRVIDGEEQIYRRSRGYVPGYLSVRRGSKAPVILGVGGEMKNSFCLLKKEQAFMSQYIGEIDSVEGEENLFASLSNFQKLIGVNPEIVAYDSHPGYHSAQVALKIYAPAYEQIQHHHAHLASCMADNEMENEEVIGIILDGTGYGPDGNLWGFEAMTGNYSGFKRRYHLAYVPLPGGEMAIRQPWRTAVAYLITFLQERGKKYAAILFKDKKVDIIEKMVVKGFNSPLSSGCGRLFDAVSALTGICLENTYEGQAAIELGEVALQPEEGIYFQPYSYEISDGIVFPGSMMEEILKDKFSGVPAEIISTKFHQTMVYIICELTERTAAITGLKKVVLSGGTWQNSYLLQAVKRVLKTRGYQVLTHSQAPANDGGIALGQVMIANWRWQEKCV